jgi:hypothetical protein
MRPRAVSLMTRQASSQMLPMKSSVAMTQRMARL